MEKERTDNVVLKKKIKQTIIFLSSIIAFFTIMFIWPYIGCIIFIIGLIAFLIWTFIWEEY